MGFVCYGYTKLQFTLLWNFLSNNCRNGLHGLRRWALSLSKARKLSRATSGNIRQNLFLALSTTPAGVPVAELGCGIRSPANTVAGHCRGGHGAAAGERDQLRSARISDTGYALEVDI